MVEETRERAISIITRTDAVELLALATGYIRRAPTSTSRHAPIPLGMPSRDWNNRERQMFTYLVDGKSSNALMDTGATYSTMRSVDPCHLNLATATVMGYDGMPMKNCFTKLLIVKIGNKTFIHRFLSSPACPINLLGRDILQEVQSSVHLEPKGTIVELPGHPPNTCSDYTPTYKRQAMLAGLDSSGLPTTDVYWLQLTLEISKCPLIDQWGLYLAPWHWLLPMIPKPWD